MEKCKGECTHFMLACADIFNLWWLVQQTLMWNLECLFSSNLQLLLIWSCMVSVRTPHFTTVSLFECESQWMLFCVSVLYFLRIKSTLMYFGFNQCYLAGMLGNSLSWHPFRVCCFYMTVWYSSQRRGPNFMLILILSRISYNNDCCVVFFTHFSTFLPYDKH